MPAASFNLTSHWTAAADIDAAFEILSDVEGLVDWWPEVYLGVEVVAPGDETGVGRRARLVTKGWAPYRIRWTATSTEIVRPTRLALRAEGELNGEGVWTLAQDGDTARIRYDWRVDLADGWMRRAAPLLKPFFTWNHDWAMRKGETGLRRAIAARGEARSP